MIHFIVAFQPEAQTLIEAYKLNLLADSKAFRMYTNKTGDISLTLSGPGKEASTAAVTHTFDTFKSNKAAVWINLGIAGHATASIGDLYLCDKITDTMTAESWYPQINFSCPCKTTKCMTLDKPNDQYQDALFDMEASGFYSACSRIALSELTHSIKIISDNASQSFEKIDRKQVSKLIHNQLDNIADIVTKLKLLSAEFQSTLPVLDHIEAFCKKWHFTETEKIHLKNLLQRWQILMPDNNPFEKMSVHKSGKAVLKNLKQTLDEQNLIFD